MSRRNISTTLNAYRACVSGYTLDKHQPGESRSIDSRVLTFDGALGVLPNVPARKLNIQYAVREFLWYCRANRFDHSITKHATMWKKLVQLDGGINSNYGQYMFNEYRSSGGKIASQFDFVVNELIKNRDTRRSVMVLLKEEHLYQANTDMVCTYGLQFMIRDNMLNMHVSMRSNDVVWGLTNDAFCFNMVQRMVCAALQVTYPGLVVGEYFHHAVSLHVYSRHYKLAEECSLQIEDYEEVNPPMMDVKDVHALLNDQQEVGGPFMKWVRDVCPTD